MLGNAGFFAVPSFPAECAVSFDESIGSDHAALIVEIPLIWDAPPPPPIVGWKVDSAMENMWKTWFQDGGHALPSEPVNIPSFMRRLQPSLTVLKRHVPPCSAVQGAPLLGGVYSGGMTLAGWPLLG
jgi:hypothetical protein